MRKRHKRAGVVGVAAALGFSALGVAFAAAGTDGANSPTALVSAGSVVAGHTVSYLPSVPYPLSRGTGTCVGGSTDPNKGCWSPTALPKQDSYSFEDPNSMQSTGIRLVIHGPEAYALAVKPSAESQDKAFTANTVKLNGADALVETSPKVIQLSWQLPNGDTGSLVALNISMDQVLMFAAGIS